MGVAFIVRAREESRTERPALKGVLKGKAEYMYIESWTTVCFRKCGRIFTGFPFMDLGCFFLSGNRTDRERCKYLISSPKCHQSAFFLMNWN